MTKETNEVLMNIFSNIAKLECIKDRTTCRTCKFAIEEFSDDDLELRYKCILLKTAEIILLTL